MTNRILSGVQPTGNLHLGNYLGAIKNWVDMQRDYECLFCIVDLHALTTPQDPKVLYQSTLDTAATYIACGIDPSHSVIFNQSMIPAHSELAWLLGTITPLGWLNRMTQFKEKAGKHKENSGLGLYSYPVLMAADILLYQATHVPVGHDQKQHLELTRDIAGAFNRQYEQDFFTLPEPVILGQATRVMSLRDGTKKMSKSDPSEYSRIHLTDDNDTIALKIKKAKSDMHDGISYDEDNRPEATNLLNILMAITGQNRDEAIAHYASMDFSTFKQELTEIVIAHLEPIRTQYLSLKNDPDYLLDILKQGAEKADNIAQSNVSEIKHLMGLVHTE